MASADIAVKLKALLSAGDQGCFEMGAQLFQDGGGRPCGKFAAG